jgi:hypothetical protein
VLKFFHQEIHFGRIKLHFPLNQEYYGIIEKECLNFIKNCPTCQVSFLNNIKKLFFFFLKKKKKWNPIKNARQIQAISKKKVLMKDLMQT